MAAKRVARAASQQFADLQSAYSRLYNAHSDLQARYAALQDRHLGLLVLLDGATVAPSEPTPTIN
jgi:hypothetical protein